ncbi:MAG TPA: class I SAM-dependent methyltransferase [Myxococcota bacterium]|nr:class I SAM-dependent methyltransferase [Myxococcota bacterium]
MPESPDCLLCGESAFEVVLDDVRDLVWRKEGRFTLQRCCECGLVMTRPRPTAEELTTYYEDAYSGRGEQAEAKRKGATSLMVRLLGAFRMTAIGRGRSLRAEDHVLDVGCSYGGFLKVLRDEVGCRTSGIDFDAGSIAGAIEPERCDYRSGTLLEAGYEGGSFSVVTFIECLEHDPHPLDSLEEAHRVLADEGIVVVEVPSWDGAWRQVFGRFWLPLLVPQHLVHFRPASLRAAMEQAGFEVLHLQSMFFPLEGVASLWLWLVDLLDIPPLGAEPTWRTPLHVLLFASLIVPLWFLVEVPSQLLLRLVGRSGHVLAVGKKQ